MRMSDEILSPPTDAADNAELDLYCLECGYNLRGLSGDPRRCPECGHLNPVGELHMPAEAIQKQLRDMENAAVACVAALALLFVGIVPLGLALVRFLRFWAWNYPFLNPLVYLLGAAAAAWWVKSVLGFRAFCFARPGWFFALVKYHLYALTLLAALIGSFIGWGYLLWKWTGPWYRGRVPWTYYAGIFSFTAAIVFAIRTGLAWLHRRFRMDTAFLEREVALLIARDRARWLMRGGRRRGWFG